MHIFEQYVSFYKFEKFINEVVSFSEINHRNVVKAIRMLLGDKNSSSCLRIHFQWNSLSIYTRSNWGVFNCIGNAFSIVVEISGALLYLRLANSIPIYHRDIKSANILLDDKYHATVADFGTLKPMTID